MNDQTTLSGGDAVTGAAEPATERIISDVETLKALSDPVRLRILETMVTTLFPYTTLFRSDRKSVV